MLARLSYPVVKSNAQPMMVSIPVLQIASLKMMAAPT
jgi:hypothetical protein